MRVTPALHKTHLPKRKFIRFVPQDDVNSVPLAVFVPDLRHPPDMVQKTKLTAPKGSAGRSGPRVVSSEADASFLAYSALRPVLCP